MTPFTTDLGSVASLHRYPVKSMMGEELNSSMIGPKGLVGDRLFALSDSATGKIASAKNPRKWPNLFSYHATYTTPLDPSQPIPSVRITLPDGETVLSTDPDLEETLTQRIGQPVRFLSSAPTSGTLEEYWPDIEGLPKNDEVTDEAMPSETFYDLAMVHLLTTSTIDALRKTYPEGRIEPRRFRPNIMIATEGSGFIENTWHGQILLIGDSVKLQVTGPCPRCVMTTLAQGDLPKDNGVLRTAVKNNQAHVGIYASVLQGGTIHRGDQVRLASDG